jgi:hypothetical protein
MKSENLFLISFNPELISIPFLHKNTKDTLQHLFLYNPMAIAIQSQIQKAGIRLATYFFFSSSTISFKELI